MPRTLSMWNVFSDAIYIHPFKKLMKTTQCRNENLLIPLCYEPLCNFISEIDLH